MFLFYFLAKFNLYFPGNYVLKTNILDSLSKCSGYWYVLSWAIKDNNVFSLMLEYIYWYSNKRVHEHRISFDLQTMYTAVYFSGWLTCWKWKDFLHHACFLIHSKLFNFLRIYFIQLGIKPNDFYSKRKCIFICRRCHASKVAQNMPSGCLWQFWH